MSPVPRRAIATAVLLLALALCTPLSIHAATPFHRHARGTPLSALASASLAASTPSPTPAPTLTPTSPSTERHAGESISPRSVRHPSQGGVANLQIDPATDCAFRSVAIEVVTARQPADARSNWTALAESAFQMQQCSSHAQQTTHAASAAAKPVVVATAETVTCAHELFVDAERGDDSSEGSEAAPFRSVSAALAALRSQRRAQARLARATACLTLRAGRYHLGGQAAALQLSSASSSRVGALHLTADDSNVVVQGAAGEEAVLSGGVELGKLQWTVWKNSSAGPIMQATLPAHLRIDAAQFNELYVDGVAAVRAKYPNGDPYTHGLYSSPSGYIGSAASWLPSRSSPDPIHIHVSEPSRNGTYFQYYDLGVEGGASVFDPPSNFWSQTNPLAGDRYAVPGGVRGGAELEGRAQKWTNVQRGLVHAFHGGYWGSWIFEIASVVNTTITFGRGGFQEARGRGDGGSYYVSNLLEELDAPNEWYYEPDSRTLYFMPNATTGMPRRFVAAQRACLVSIVGSPAAPAANITLRNVVLTETSNTYLASYEAPASGDWAVHRGGSVYVEGGQHVAIEQSLFTYVATNAVVLSEWNYNVSVVHNEFVWLGDSGVLVLGSSSGIDGVSNTAQPDLVHISNNILHETGAYVKQSAPCFVALSRRVSFTRNVLFNVPRSGININDGFAGNKTIAWNVMFNTVRETGDHGPINTWDRVPYLTEQRDGPGHASVTPHDSYIHHNLLFNSYNSYYPIDHDDGSAYYVDTYNVQVYGAKKNYLGHSKTDMYELYIYPDTRDAQGVGVCIADQAPQPGQSGWGEVWTNNRCLLYASQQVYNIWYCDVERLFTPLLANNTIYAPIGQGLNTTFPCNRNGSTVQLSLKEWQSYGLDLGTTVEPAPALSDIVQWVRDMLFE